MINKLKESNELIFFIQSLLIITAYLINDFLGFLVSIVLITINYFQRDNWKEFLFFNLIITLPVSYLSIIGSKFHHILSWFYILLFLLFLTCIIEFIRGKLKVSKLFRNFFIVYFILYIIYLINISFNWDRGVLLLELFDFVRLSFLLLTTTFVLSDNEIIGLNSRKYILGFGFVILASAFGLFIQYFLFKNFGLIVGNLTQFGGGRNSYDLFFISYSTFSIVLGLGALIFMLKFFQTKQLLYVVLAVFILLASSLNSSRTGLVSFSGSLILYVLFDKNTTLIDKIKNLGIIFLLAGLALIALIQIRPSLISIFHSSGRIDLIIDAITVFTQNIQTISLGLGPYFIENMAPHIFIVELITTYGIFLGISIILYFIYIIYLNRHSKFIITVLYIFVAGLFVTKIQLVTWLYPLIFINYISHHEEINVEKI